MMQGYYLEWRHALFANHFPFQSFDAWDGIKHLTGQSTETQILLHPPSQYLLQPLRHLRLNRHQRDFVLRWRGVVVNVLDLQMPVFPHRVRRARQAVTRLTKTAGVDDVRVPNASNRGDVRVPQQNHIRINPFQLLSQFAFRHHRKIERARQRFARRAVREEKFRATQFDARGGWQRREIREIGGAQLAQGVLARGNREFAVFFRRREIRAGRGCVIVIAAHDVRRVRARPSEARRGIGTIADHVAEEEERVRRLFARVQRGERFEVGVEVGEDDDSHQ